MTLRQDRSMGGRSVLLAVPGEHRRCIPNPAVATNNKEPRR